MSWRWRTLLLLGVVAAAVYIFNASWRVAPPADPQVALIAHRGVHQTFSREDLENDTCTAERIYPPEHAFIENTLSSMRAAFDAGADIVELDVHPTTDGQFAVLHDWTIDCRTEGTGETRSHDMAYLKTLDIGYGYTADGGATYPLRGTGVGQMPELKEVLSAMPDRQFLVNFKSREQREGDMLASLVSAHPEWRHAVWGAYGGDEPTYRAAELIEGLAVWSRRGLVDCLLQYEALGWSGYMPAACRDTKVMVPLNVAPFLWGWPNLFLERLRHAGSEVILLGPTSAGDPGTAGIDTLEQLAEVPESFDGYLWTNRIEIIGPALAAR
ncbi:glycerophosphodiester phosphodiesterase [Devosia oryziradicis]|uniref:Glycerophosphodiester phosphodiesterase n=1 Tax=Devosia oryziradicis TaxID=2801335 RepID=A0ABX7BRY5_9HYPH|nr:glycerophosphodiester phosphodiesterase family protein [Devosia oryziradicis]QQR34699.1 glycerophosphodiester phosphodiesterase [Devosia oryziradicis]